MAKAKVVKKLAKKTVKKAPVVAATSTPVSNTPVSTINRASVKSMTPRHADKYTGEEPTWTKQPVEAERRAQVIKGFNWYNYSYGKKEAAAFIVDWLNRVGQHEEAKQFKNVPEKLIKITMGWMCRMNIVGLDLNDEEEARVNAYITDVLAAPKKEVKEEVAEVKDNKPNIQDRLRAKAGECAGELESMFDDFVLAGCKLTADYKPVAVMRSMNIAPQMIGDVAARWKNYLAEFEEVAAGKDADLVEGYSNFNKVQIRNIVKFAELVVNDCGTYVQIKKVERKPRKKKAVSPEKQVARYKFATSAPDLKIVGERPTKLLGSSEVWLYNYKKRKLIHVVADAHIGSLAVKGNMLVGFSVSETTQKTLRKPAEQLKALMGASKPNSRKIYKDIKATETKFNGRGTAWTLILKA